MPTVASAAEVYAQQRHVGQESIDFAHGGAGGGLRRLGEVLKATPKTTGTKS